MSAGVHLFFIVASRDDCYQEHIALITDITVLLTLILSEKRLPPQQNSEFLRPIPAKISQAAVLLQHLLVFDVRQESEVFNFSLRQCHNFAHAFAHILALNLACAAR